MSDFDTIKIEELRQEIRKFNNLGCPASDDVNFVIQK